MPFGLDIPDINPFNDEDEKPKRPKKPKRVRTHDVPIPRAQRAAIQRKAKENRQRIERKRKREKREKVPEPPGFLETIGKARKELRSYPGVIGTIIGETGKAASKDIRNALPGKDPFPYAMERDPKTGKLRIARDRRGKPIRSGGHLFESLAGFGDVIATESARSAKDIGLVVAADDWTIKAIKQFDKDLARKIERKAKQAEIRLAEAPIGNLAGILGGAGIASKAITVPAMARQMQKANPEMNLSSGAARSAAAKELRRPGWAATQGIKGGLPSRYIENAEGEMVVGKPWSRTPGGRAGQTLYDEITKQIDRASPNAPFSASKRQASAQRRRSAQENRTHLAALTPHIEALGDILEGTESRRNVKGQVRKAFGVQRPIRERAEALIAALEGPQDASIRQSVEARIASLEDTLAKSAELTPQYNRVRVLRAKLKRGVASDTERAALATELREITDSLDLALGRRVAPVTGSPERRAAIREWTKRFNKRKANALITVADAIARAQNPTDPKAWYATNLAEVTSEAAEAFVQRIDPIAAQYQTSAGVRRGLTTGRARSLTPDEAIAQARYRENYERGDLDIAQIGAITDDGRIHFFSDGENGWNLTRWAPEGDQGGLTREIAQGLDEPTVRHMLADHERILTDTRFDVSALANRLIEDQGNLDEIPVFYSELQRQVDRLFEGKTQRMVAQSLRAKLKNNVSKVEWEAMGMEDFFKTYHPTERITETEMQEFLAHPLNAYNLNEIIYSSLEIDGPYKARWHDQGNFNLVAKKPTPEEPYYELVMQLGREAKGRETYRKEVHWVGVNNPIVHIRFHIITDNTGKRAILIDEIQSDWMSDYRKRQGKGTAQELADLERRHDELRAAQQAQASAPYMKRIDELENREWELTKEINNAKQAIDDYDGGDPEDYAQMEDAVQELENELESVLEEQDRVDALIDQKDEVEFDHLENELVTVNRQISEMKRVLKTPDWDLDDSAIDAAVRRTMRWAHDADIDRIIVVPGEMQAYRNMKMSETPSGTRIPEVMDDNDWQPFIRAWQEFEGMDHDAVKAFGRRQADDPLSRIYFKLYEKDLPGRLEHNIGHKGRWMPDIFNGRYGDEAGYFVTPEEPVGAYVIDLGEEGRRRAAIPMRQMQQQPEWDALPRGATELLADGRRAMRLFEGADVDTVIHELAHIALTDIDDVARETLQRHFGGPIDDWTTGQHEAFARAFEQYMRTGRAANVHLASAFTQIAKWMRGVWQQLYPGRLEDGPLHPEVASAFDKMLGYKGVPTVLNKTERSQVKSQIKALTDALDLPLESDEYKHAADTLAAISEQIEAAGEAILTRHAPPALAEAIKEGLANRRDIMTTRMAEQGVLPEGMEWTPEMRARGYFPQTSIWDIQGMPSAGPVRMQAVQDVVGTPRLENKTVMRKPNRLIRYSTGEVLNDPAVLMRVLRSRLRYLDTLEARNELWEKGKSIKKGEKIPKGVALVRHPERTPEKIADDIYAALRLDPERYAELEMRGKMDDIDEADSMQEAVEDFIWVPEMGAKPNWVSSDPNVRAVPLQVARTRLGDVFASGSRNLGPALAGSANAMARLAAIYLPFAGTRYVTRNAAQNAVMLAMTQPTALARIGRRHSKYKADHPEDYAMIMAEGGTILGTALPEFNTRPKGLMQGVEQKITERTGATGSFLGKFADNPFRWASWTKHAEGYGYDTPAKYHELLTDEKLRDVRETVMQQTRDDMIDFDALTPWEKEVVSRYMFLWPFIRGITKWPFMYLREYPLRVAAVGAAERGVEQEEDPLGTGAIRERLMRGGRDFGWLDPTGPMQENWERLTRVKEGRAEVKLSAIADMLAPHWREIIQSMSDRQGVTWKKALANTYVPFASTVNALNRGGSKIDQLDRFLGQNTEPPISIAMQRQKRADEINHYLDLAAERGLTVPEEPLNALLTAHNAYEKYKELSARVQFGLRDQGKDPSIGKDSKNHRLRAAMLLAIAEEFYPGQVPFTLEDYDDLTQEGRDKFFSEVEKGLWGMRQDFLREAKEEFDKEEAVA